MTLALPSGTQKYIRALRTSGLEQLDNVTGNRMAVKALPGFLINKWRSEVSKWKDGMAVDTGGKSFFPPFECFAKFLKTKADSMNVPELTGIHELGRKPGKQNVFKKSNVNSDSFSASERAERPAVSYGTNVDQAICVYCGDKHHVNECGKIGEIEDYNEKRKIYWDKYLCYGCGMKGDRNHSIRN